MRIQRKFLLALLTAVLLVASPIIIRAQDPSFSYNQTSDSQALIGSNSAGAGPSTDTFSLTNSTGTTWTDYSIVVGAPSGEGGTINESYFTGCSGTLSLVTAPGNTSPNTGIYVDQCDMTVSVAPGTSISFTVGIGAGEPGWSVYGTPSTGEAPPPPPPTVPEPTTMLLLSSGLIGIAGLRRKFSI